jgi:hypothetical protein
MVRKRVRKKAQQGRSFRSGEEKSRRGACIATIEY